MTVIVSGKSRAQQRLAAWLLSASAVAVAASPATAQTAQTLGGPDSSDAAPGAGAPGDIIVTGIRNANENAIRIKRSADTVVDAISAEDIGALPDKSITETLQRIPGVAVNRFAAINDPDHVSEEGQSPVIRGLPYVLSQFNGRDAFTANRGRALNFQDIPPDLAATIEVYKNQTADQIEGGIAGVINIVTRRPLDTTKDLFVVNADANWGDQRETFTPEGSVLVSHQWDTGAGRFGLLASASYSKIDERVDNARVTTYRDRRAADPTRGILASSSGPVTGGLPGVDYYVPLGGGYSRQDNDRTRIGASFAAQWESNDGALLATVQGIHSETTQYYLERTIAPVEDTGANDIVGGVSAAKFNAQNVFLSGTLGQQDGSGVDTQELTRGERLRSTTNDLSAHVAWKATERLSIDLDGQYVKSTSSTLDASIVAVATPLLALSNTQSFPTTVFVQPSKYVGAFYNEQPIGYFTSGSSATADPNTTFWRSSQDHQDNTNGREFAFRADGKYDFGDDSLIRRLRFGARYADRQQTIRSDGYNWGNLSERWNGGSITTPALETPAGFGVVQVGNFFRGATAGVPIFGLIGNPALNYNQLQAGDQAIIAIHNPGYHYSGLQTGSRNSSAPDPASINPGAGDGFHNLGEVSTNDEKTIAGYGRIDFGRNDIDGLGGITIDGNVGLRFVHTDSSSSGYFSVPSVQGAFGVPAIDCSTYKPVNSTGLPGYNICLNSAAFRTALLTFLGTGNTTYTPNTTSDKYDDWLPSFNLRVAINPKLQYRFAYSKAITRPSFNDLRNYTQFFVPGPVGTLAAEAPFPDIALKAQSYGNPLLLPTKSDNFDVTQEFYYSKAGSVTVGLFYKRVSNIYSVLNGIAGVNSSGSVTNVGVDPANPSVINYTNNGVTLPAYNAVTTNNNHAVNIKGVELDWRQGDFPFLPRALSGLGASFNFTYIDADKLQYQPVLAANYDTSPGTGYNASTGYLTSFAFPGISKYNLNAEVFYEKYGIQARLAYSWRSSYFVSSQDSLGPNDPTYTGASGFVDGSVFYSITPNIKVGATASNILNETITTYNVINRAGLEALRSVNQADRRVTAGIRLGF